MKAGEFGRTVSDAKACCGALRIAAAMLLIPVGDECHDDGPVQAVLAAAFPGAFR